MTALFIDEVHAQNILQHMWEQTERKEFCDISLIAGDTEEMQISAHRAVLSASSEYFKTMFSPPFNESTAKEVKLPNVDGESLKSIVKFCYSGRLEISEDTAEKLLVTANSLLLDTVEHACIDFLVERLHPNNCLDMAQLAERHHCDKLLKETTDFCMKHFVDLYKTDEFLNLSAEQLTTLLSSDDLCDPTEEHVFKSLMLWLEHDRSEREQHKDEMLKLVRLPLLEPSFLLEHVQPVCNSPVSLQLYTEATDCHLFPKRKRVSASKFPKPRRSYECLMAIKIKNWELNILYHCPNRLKWMKWADSLEYRQVFAVAVMEDDLFIVGGIQYNTINTVIRLNLKTMILKNINPMCQRRAYFGVAVINGFLYAVGGHSGDGVLSSVERWDSKSNTWNMVASMSVERYEFGITVFNGKIYVVGGNTDSELLVSSAECYNPEENEWTSIASICEARNLLGLAVANGMLYAVSVNINGTIERYDHETNKWTILCSFGEEICGILYTSFNDKVIALHNDRVDEYNPTTNEWNVNTSIKGLKKPYRTFLFSGSILESKFIEN